MQTEDDDNDSGKLRSSEWYSLAPSLPNAGGNRAQGDKHHRETKMNVNECSITVRTSERFGDFNSSTWHPK